MYVDNSWYGHDRILADYCSLERVPPIFGALRHGWEPFPQPGLGERRLSIAPLFVWNEEFQRILIERGVPNVRCIGSPFAYLCKTLFPSGPPLPAGGTLLFPAHSSDGFSFSMNTRDLIKEIEDVSPGPYTVSIFYQDLDSPDVDIYRERGWRVVSFGNRSTPNFLVRLAAELASHSHVLGNDPQVGSAMMYAALLGRNVRVMSPASGIVVTRRDTTESRARELVELHLSVARNRFPRLMNTGIAGDEAMEVGRVELGWYSLLTPEELSETLGWSSPLRVSLAKQLARINRLRVSRHTS